MQRLRQQPAALLILGLLLAGIAHGLLEIVELAQAHWAQPNLFGDSFTFVQRSAEPGWLTAQHNEHRILWAKAASLVETELLKLPPGQSALFQNLALILGCAGLWSWLCRRLLQRTDLCLITALAGGLLLLNPWQYENIGWEFQTPWVALTSTGQGLAMAVTFAACAWLHSRRLGALVTASTAVAGLTWFVILPYSKPAGHPELSFQLDYFLRTWLGGPWQGLAVLAVVIAAVLLGRRQPIARSHWPALLMPGLFSVLFAGMITLSRAGFGVEQANSSRYISHSLMLGLTALLALALTDDRSNRPSTPLLGGFLVLFTTLGSFPQGLQPDGLSYAGAWAEGQRWAEQKRQRFICHAEQAALATENIQLLEPCKEIHPDQSTLSRYFQGSWSVKPLGWHQKLLDAKRTTSGAIRYQLDQQTTSPTTLQLQGWAFLSSVPNQQILSLADYGAKPKLAIPVNQPRRDVKRAHDLPNKNVGFDAVIPRSQNGKPLRTVSVGTPSKSVQI